MHKLPWNRLQTKPEQKKKLLRPDVPLGDRYTCWSLGFLCERHMYTCWSGVSVEEARENNRQKTRQSYSCKRTKCAATFSSSFVSAIHRLFSFWKTVWFAIRTVRGRWWRGAAVRWLCRCRFRRSRVCVSLPPFFFLSLSRALPPPSRELVRVRVCASCLFVVCV